MSRNAREVNVVIFLFMPYSLSLALRVTLVRNAGSPNI
jgi:hypothetical protein